MALTYFTARSAKVAYPSSQDILGCLLLAVSLIGALDAYSTGAPDTAEVCQSMFPGHGVDAQTTQPPFVIQLSKKTFSEGGDKIGVTLKALHGYFIGGFLMQARSTGNCRSCDQKKPMGTFELYPDEEYLKTINCNGAINSSVTHKSKKPLDMAVFNWILPEKPEGHFYLVATVVKQKKTFWTTVYSEPIIVSPFAASPKVCPAPVFLNSTGDTCPTSMAAGVSYMNNLIRIMLAFVFGATLYDV